MASLNHITLLGNLTRDPEMRYTPNGTSVATLGLAVNHRYRRGENWKNEVCYVDCVVFGRLAEAAAEYLIKGSPALVTGRLRWQTWEGQDGQTRTKHEVLATTVQFLPRSDPAIGTAQEPAALDEMPF